METNFTPEQLRDRKLKEADEILRRCVHCGFCIATCPTYLLLGDERESPRGRIYLIKSMLEGKAAPKEVRPHLDRCLSCFSCMTTCPSGVDYKHLSDYARERIESSSMRPPADESQRKLLRSVLPHPKRLRLALRALSAARPLRGFLARSRSKFLNAILELAPKGSPKAGDYVAPQTIKTTRQRAGRVLMMQGCVQQVLNPGLNDATVRFLNRMGYDVTLSDGEGCCGALTLHMGKEASAKVFAKQNIDAWHAEREKGGPVEAIIINTSGCGTVVKDYGHLLADDGKYADKATYVASLARDISEFAAQKKLDAPLGWSDIRVAYHAPCSLQHGQNIRGEPRQLLANAGFTVLEIPEGHICCGSAGTYSILQPALANELKARKLKAIDTVKADCIATGNIGCIKQLSGQPLPAVHTVELLDWAHGGPCPEALKHLEGRIRPLPREGQTAQEGYELV